MTKVESSYYLPSDIFGREHLFGCLATLAERGQVVEIGVAEEVAEMVRAVQIQHYCLIALHADAERIV